MSKKMLWAVGLWLGCGGSDTGNPFDKGEEGTLGGCEVVSSTKLELAAQSELGFSANDVLAFAGGTHSEALSWQTLRFGSYAPEAGQQTLTLEVAARGAKFVRYRNQGGTEEASYCDPQLEIEADVTLRSSGGALNESLRATLRSKQRELAQLQVRFDPEKLKGTLVVTPPSGEGWTTAYLDFGTQFTPYGLSGSLSPLFEQRTSDSVGTGPGSGPLATFGLPGCDYGVAVPRDATGPASSASTLALLAEHVTANVGSSTATLTFEPGEQICRYLGDVYSPYPSPALAIAGTLVVKTADGAIDGRWPVNVVSKPDANGGLTGPVEVQLQNQAPNVVASFPKVDTRGYDSSSASVSFMLAASGWSGEAVVHGYKNAVCPAPQPGDQGTPGCPGAERTELARFALR